MSEWWADFIAGFCKVEVLCYAGEPNWLGGIVLGLSGLLITKSLVGFLMNEDEEGQRIWDPTGWTAFVI